MATNFFRAEEFLGWSAMETDKVVQERLFQQVFIRHLKDKVLTRDSFSNPEGDDVTEIVIHTTETDVTLPSFFLSRKRCLAGWTVDWLEGIGMGFRLGTRHGDKLRPYNIALVGLPIEHPERSLPDGKIEPDFQLGQLQDCHDQ